MSTFFMHTGQVNWHTPMGSEAGENALPTRSLYLLKVDLADVIFERDLEAIMEHDIWRCDSGAFDRKTGAATI